MTEPRKAPAAEQPCQLHRYHFPRVCRTQHHHSKPAYLQLRVYGDVRYGPDLFVCGTGHDSIHAWLDWLLGEARKPDPEPGRAEKKSAGATYAWYVARLP